MHAARDPQNALAQLELLALGTRTAATALDAASQAAAPGQSPPIVVTPTPVSTTPLSSLPGGSSLARLPAPPRPPSTALARTRARPPKTPDTLPPATSMALHRSRMRQKLLTAGPDALLDHELLEMALFVAIPRCDTKPIARRLLARFGSFANAIAAPAGDIAGVEGMGEASAAALKIIQAAAQRLARGEATRLPVLSNWDALMDYLNGVMGREKIEQLRILFLDAKNRLIGDEAQSRGTVNHTPVYPREVVRRALELQAAAIILCHNHPSGDPTPSRDDIVMTQQIVAAAKVLSVAVHDHVIIGNGSWLSFRREGLL